MLKMLQILEMLQLHQAYVYHIYNDCRMLRCAGTTINDFMIEQKFIPVNKNWFEFSNPRGRLSMKAEKVWDVGGLYSHMANHLSLKSSPQV